MYDLPSRVVNFKNKNELPFKVAIDPEGKILGEFEQVKLTTTIISDKNKVIKQTIIGEINYEDLKEILKLDEFLINLSTSLMIPFGFIPVIGIIMNPYGSIK